MQPPKMDPLSRLAVRFGSDKFGVHLYTPLYNQVLGHLRDLPIRLLEIGVGGYEIADAGGSSLRMWSEYFPFAKIVGLDITKKNLKLGPRTTLVEGSQADCDLLQIIVDEHGPFDVIIDDGSHAVPHVLATLLYMYPRMAADGIYIVEDTQTSFLPATGGNHRGQGTIFHIAHMLSLAMHRLEGFVPEQLDEIDVVSLGEITESVRVCRNIIFFQRGDNSYPSNFGLNLEDRRVRQIYDDIEREAKAHPASRSSLSRIDMLIWAGKVERAVELALQTASAHPTDKELLTELIRLMESVQPNEAVYVLRERLANVL